MKDCKHCDMGYLAGHFGQDVECVNGVLIDIDEAHEGHGREVRPVAPCHPMWERQLVDPYGETWENDSIDRLDAWAETQPLADESAPSAIDGREGHTGDVTGMVERPKKADDNCSIADIPIGHVQWHSSEEDGGPDVGVMLRLNETQALWLGELLSAEGGGVGFAVYTDREKLATAPLDDLDAVREIIEGYVAPAIRGLCVFFPDAGNNSIDGRTGAIEECARVAEQFCTTPAADGMRDVTASSIRIAAAIRALGNSGQVV